MNQQLDKAAINYAAESLDSQNLSMLLHQSNCKVNLDYQFDGETALNTLAKSLTPENVAPVSNCIHLLLSKGASPNLADSEGKTPLQIVLQLEEIGLESRCKLIIQFLQLPELSQHNYREGLHYVMQHYLDGSRLILYKLLVRQFTSLKNDQTLGLLADYSKSIKSWDDWIMQEVLFMEHISNNSEMALNALIGTLTLNTPANCEDWVKVAIKFGKWTTVLSLLNTDCLQKQPKDKILKALIMQTQLQPSHNNEYQNCLLRLLQSQSNCINLYDDQHNTPLYYAVLYRNEIAIRELLRHGAKLGLSSPRKRLPIEDMDVKLLEEHFDYCITSCGKKPSDEQYELIMNCTNLTNQQSELDIAPIARMAQSKELCPLLQHPLITCFLLLKWHRLSTVFYFHILIFILLNVCLVAHVILRFPQRFHQELLILILTIIISFMIVYILVVELSTYLLTRQLPSYVNTPLVTLLILTCTEWGEQDTQKIIAVFAIMLMAIKLTNLVGGLPIPSISTHMLMLRQVASNFLKCLAQYSILIFTFGLCFYIIFGTSTKEETYFSFSELDQTIIKTLAMFIGEYDDEDFKSFSSSVVLIIFMFMTMILTNLLGGLAVNDTQVSVS